ncbi:MAG: PD-(D/E)XK nuclease family protein, partial [Patescibacteria group bacterium]
KTEENLKSEDKKQLLLYQIVTQRVLGLKLEKLTYNYLQDGSTVSFLRSEKELVKLETEVEETIAAIKKGDFGAKPGMHCTFCDFASICEFRS